MEFFYSVQKCAQKSGYFNGVFLKIYTLFAHSVHTYKI